MDKRNIIKNIKQFWIRCVKRSLPEPEKDKYLIKYKFFIDNHFTEREIIVTDDRWTDEINIYDHFARECFMDYRKQLELYIHYEKLGNDA
ncbi:MAG: hypothetical protein GY870_22435 [archaeon]|nr:hypothetical protein [archaeon]